MSNTPRQPVRSPRRVRQVFKTLHLWLGLSLGLVLVLVTLTGCILTFEEPLLTAMHPELADRVVPDTAGLGHSLEHILSTPEGNKLRGIALPNGELTAFEGTAKGGDRIYFDPISGDVIAHRSGRSDPLLVLLDWHTHLLSGEVGETVLGVVACTGLFMIFSGVWLYWPGRKRALSHLRPHPRPPILRWASWHRFAGIIALPLLLIMIGTGTTMAYRGAVRTGLAHAFGEPAPAKPPKLQDAPDTKVDWSAVLLAAQAAAPDAAITRISLPVKRDTALVIRVRRPGEWNLAGRSMLWLDPFAARVIGGDDATKLGTGGRLANSLFPIHSAAVGGPVWHTLAVLGGLMPSFMLVTGFLFWRARRRPAAGA
jgi:uncharacterized iron-regulated membrane protein